MIIQDAITACEDLESPVIHNPELDVFFSVNGDLLNPMLPLFDEVDCKMILSDKWECMEYEEFENKHEMRCKKKQDEFFSKRWIREE